MYNTLKPTRFSPVLKATKKQFDNVTIIHYPRNLDFRPIVLCKNEVKSGRIWRVATFYDGLLKAIKVCRSQNYRGELDNVGHAIRSRRSNIVYWGCRRFTIRQLLLIKKTMEQEYTKKQLGARE